MKIHELTIEVRVLKKNTVLASKKRKIKALSNKSKIYATISRSEIPDILLHPGDKLTANHKIEIENRCKNGDKTIRGNKPN